LKEIQFHLIEQWKTKLVQEMTATRSVFPLTKLDIKGSFKHINRFSWRDKGLILAKASLCSWTNDRINTKNNSHVLNCPFCDKLDSTDHRLFECESFISLRDMFIDTISWARSQPAFTRAFGL
jgi:hypothetical protein